MSLGKNISDYRKKQGISQEKLAELLGISRQAVTKWENEKTNPDTENLIRLSEVFGCSIDELCEKDEKKPEPKINPISHILAAFSVLIVAAYCIFGGIMGNFHGGTLILLIILAVPMHVFTHLIFLGMVKSGDFTMLAGYDDKIKYNKDGMRRYLSGLDFFLGFTTSSYLFLMAISELMVPEFEIQPLLLFGYILSFVAGIFFMGYKFGDEIYEDPIDAKRAKRAMPSSVVMVVLLLLSVIAFCLFFSMKGYENNSGESFPMLGMMFLSIGFSIGGYLAESSRLKKEDDPKPFFGKAFIICNILAVIAMAVMGIL